MEISKKFGKRVKELRLQRKMSQGDIAKKLNVGISYISKIERGEQNLSLKGIEKLARAFGTRPDKLLL